MEAGRGAWGAAKQAVPPPPPHLARAAALQAEAFWQAHAVKLTAAGVGLAAYLTWRLTRRVARAVGALSETARDWAAEAKVVALALGSVAAAVVLVRHRHAVSPDAVYRRALARLNASPGVLEVLGAPVLGSPLRAYVETGGGLRPVRHGLLPAWRARRVQMIFPLAGSERKGLVSLEAKKRQVRKECEEL